MSFVDKIIDQVEMYPKLFSILFFFLWGGFLILFSLHDSLLPKIIYTLAVNALVVGQLYLGFIKQDGRRNRLGITLGVITGIYTILIDIIAISF